MHFEDNLVRHGSLVNELIILATKTQDILKKEKKKTTKQFGNIEHTCLASTGSLENASISSPAEAKKNYHKRLNSTWLLFTTKKLDRDMSIFYLKKEVKKEQHLEQNIRS